MATKKEKPLAERFAEAKGRVEQLTKRPTNDQLLELYAFYKQATEGDVTGSRPGLLDLKGRAKFDAWTKSRPEIPHLDEYLKEKGLTFVPPPPGARTDSLH